jgi:iron-sulfur cluster repair protein YtfE (RIC family)
MDLENSVLDWVIEYPQVLPLFQELRIDYCCGGKSLLYACHANNLDPRVVMALIEQLTRSIDTIESSN